MFRNLKNPVLIVFIGVVCCLSCSKRTDPEWLPLIPATSPVLEVGISPGSSSAFDDIAALAGTPSELSEIVDISVEYTIVGRALVAEGVDQLAPLWVLDVDQNRFVRALVDSGWVRSESYDAGYGEVQTFNKGSITLVMSQKRSLMIVSTNSFVIELALRSNDGDIAHFPQPTNEGSIQLNSAALGSIVAPSVMPEYRSLMARVLAGGGVSGFTITPDSSDAVTWLTASFPTDEQSSVLMRYLRSTKYDETLHSLVPMGASLAMFWSDPYGVVEYDDIRWNNIPGGNDERLGPHVDALKQALLPSIALVVMDGTTGEIAFIRKANIVAAGSVLADLYQRGYIDGQNDVFTSRSRYLARIIGSALCNFEDYAFGLGSDYIVISESENLVRRLMVTDDGGSLDLHPRFQELSGNTSSHGATIWMNMTSLLSASRTAGWLSDDPKGISILNYANHIVIQTDARVDGKLEVRAGVNRQQRNDTVGPVLVWQYPLRDTQLESKPIITTLNGIAAVIATTQSGRVLAVSPTGKLLFDVTTGSQKPKGSVLMYDWYANRSPVVMQAAGTTIYAWSPTGSLLPGFPFVIDAPISAPIHITDANNDGEPDIVVATADERLHLINRDGRGQFGWPVYTSGVVESELEISGVGSDWRVRVSFNGGVEEFDRTGQRTHYETTNRVDISPADTAAIGRDIQVFEQWDVNADGTKDIIRYDPKKGLEVIDGARNRSLAGLGSLRFASHILVADFNDDGYPEIITLVDGQLRCYRIDYRR